MPVADSTNGYCQDIGSAQYLHLPESKRKLATGMRSRQLNSWRHAGHRDLPCQMGRLESMRQMTAFRKEPTTRPKRKMKTDDTIIGFHHSRKT